jgi:hypothetical protein
MIFTSTRELVFQHLAHILGCRPSQHEIDTVVANVAARTHWPKDLEQIVKEEATKFARSPS